MSAWIQHIPSSIAAVGSLAALVSSILNHRKIQEVKVHINSRFDEFVTEARRVARAEGHAEGIEAAREKHE